MNRNIREIFVLIILTLLAYIPSLPNLFVWDDEQFIVKNKYVESFDVVKIFSSDIVAGSGFTSNYYRPLVGLSFAIDHAIWGYNPLPFRLVNILLHLSVGLLLYFFLQQLGFWTLSFWLSAFFLIHPVQVEAVTYINSRGDSMYSLFLFLTLNTFLQLYKGRREILKVFVILIAYTFSLLSKEIALITLPLIIITLIYKSEKHKKSVWVSVLLLLVISGIYIWLRLTIFNFENSLNFYKQANIYADNVFIRLFTFCRVLFEYLYLIFFPYSLHMERSVPLVTSGVSYWVIGAIVIFLCLSIWGYIQYRRNNNRIYLFAMFWFICSLIPVSGVIPINGMLYEHWLYIPLIGILIWVFAFVQQYLYRLVNYYIIKFISWVLIICCIILTVRQNGIWKDPVTLFTYTLQHVQTTRLYTNLAVELANAGRVEEAIPYYIKATTYDDSFPHTYYNLGNAYFSLKDFDNAERAYLHAIQMENTFYFAYPNLINTYLLRKQYDKALKYFEIALPKFSNDEMFYIAYGVTLYKAGRVEQSDAVLHKIIEMSNDKEGVRKRIELLKHE